ncbi:MAG TPA: hypothetical protein VJ778_03655 [Burkholderiales bacterium]|nr:hypothetical protein [Burkholderiales bacterium]
MEKHAYGGLAVTCKPAREVCHGQTQALGQWSRSAEEVGGLHKRSPVRAIRFWHPVIYP